MIRAAAATDKSHDTEVVVIGAGIGGLCAGALLAKYGKKVTVVGAHDVPGGAAHSWHRDGFTFESGPSLYSGMSRWPTTNPCGQVLHALDEPLECVYYNTWMCHLPEGSFLTEVGNDQFVDVLKEYVPDVDGVNMIVEQQGNGNQLQQVEDGLTPATQNPFVVRQSGGANIQIQFSSFYGGREQ